MLSTTASILRFKGSNVACALPRAPCRMLKLTPTAGLTSNLLKQVTAPRTPWAMHVRNFARGPGQGGSRFSRPQARPVQVAEQAEQQQYQELERQQQQGMYYEKEEDKFAGEKAHEAISRDIGLQQYMSGVYGTLMGTVGISAAGSVAAMATPLGLVHPLIPVGASFGVLIYMSMFTSPQSHSSTFRGGLLGTFGFLSGMGMAPLLSMATAMDPMIVPSALLATTGMFGVMSASALMMPKGKLSSLGAPLFGGMIGLLGVSVVGWFTPPTSPWYGVLHSVNLYGGLGIFSLFIAYDTQMMIQDYEEGNRDKIMAALNMFINIKIVFQKFLFIFIGRSD